MTGTGVETLNEVIHGRLRLGVMAYLASAGSASFGDLKAQTGASDGNLSVHLRKLEEAGYLTIDKAFKDRRPLTTATLTAEGRKAWLAYLEQMRAILESGG